MPFKWKTQKEFYIDYYLKHGQTLTEATFNLPFVRIKKELTDIYNRFQVTNGLAALEWKQAENYEVGEIVCYNNINYKCIVENINKIPNEETEFWQEATASDYSTCPFYNYLSLDNQTPYEPLDLKEYEQSYQYHPATVKFTEDRLRYWFDNEIVANADRLDGEHKDFFCYRSEYLELLKTSLTKENVVDDLITTSKVLPLSANQGKILKDLVDRINALITSNDVNLDEMQEIVNWIKRNREMIQSLGIDSINGLREYLNRINSELRLKPTLQFLKDNIIKIINQENAKFKTQNPNLKGLNADTLDGFHSSYFLASSKFNAREIAHLLEQVPGSLGRIDADKLDGLDSTEFLKRSSSDAPTQDNVYSLGSSAKRWANIYAMYFQGTALKARWADLAEIYDNPTNEQFKYGTIIGINEDGSLEKFNFNKHKRPLGVVSHKPGFILNSDSKGVLIALKGQTPVYIEGAVKIGDEIYAENNGVASTKNKEEKYFIGIALESNNSKEIKLINVKI